MWNLHYILRFRPLEPTYGHTVFRDVFFLKLLISAYACEPEKGSEPLIGWRWSTEAAKLGHEVWVITRTNNQERIETYLRDNPIQNLRFHYYDLPARALLWKKRAGGVHLYYALWQWAAYRSVRTLAAQVHFDWVHHLTFGSHRQATHMGKLGIPLVIGPLGGGERAPFRLRAGFPIRGIIADLLRDISNLSCFINPSIDSAYRTATIILCKTRETHGQIPKRFHHKTRIQLELGIDRDMIAQAPARYRNRSASDVRVIFVGRMIYWKGPHLVLLSFARLQKEIPGSRLTMVGSGPERAWLDRLAKRINIEHSIDWLSGLSHHEVMSLYSRHDVLLFPSLHDSSGNVVLEATSQGLPVVLLDLGGPATVADANCSRLVRSAGLDSNAVAAKLADEMIDIARNPELHRKLSLGAINRAHQCEWSCVVSKFYGRLESSCLAH